MAIVQLAKKKRASSPSPKQPRRDRDGAAFIRRPMPTDFISLAVRRFRAGKYENIEVLADELGIARATAYKWVGNGERLLSEVLAVLAEEMFQHADNATKSHGAKRICEILMSISRQTLATKSFRQLLERAPEKTLRLVASKSGPVQKTAIANTEAVLRQEIQLGRLPLPLDSHTMAYVLVRLCESFLYADTIAGESIDLPKLEVAINALLGHSAKATRSPKQPTRSKCSAANAI